MNKVMEMSGQFRLHGNFGKIMKQLSGLQEVSKFIKTLQLNKMSTKCATVNSCWTIVVSGFQKFFVDRE